MDVPRQTSHGEMRNSERLRRDGELLSSGVNLGCLQVLGKRFAREVRNGNIRVRATRNPFGATLNETLLRLRALTGYLLRSQSFAPAAKAPRTSVWSEPRHYIAVSAGKAAGSNGTRLSLKNRLYIPFYHRRHFCTSFRIKH